MRDRLTQCPHDGLDPQPQDEEDHRRCGERLRDRDQGLTDFGEQPHDDAQRAATLDEVDARARSVLARIPSSYPAIALSGEAAGAAHENYTRVADAYARGVVSITDLISAQDASLNADLAQAQATFTFLTDFTDTLRVSNSFDVLLDPQTRAPWYDTVDAWFDAHGLPIATH